MFSSKLAVCCIVALHFTSSGASPVQETNALEGADHEYAATERDGSALYISLSSQYTPSSYVSDGVLHITLNGSSNVHTFSISDRPTEGARFVAPNGRLSLNVTAASSQTRVNYNGTPHHPAIAFLSINIVGSRSINNINFEGSSVTASGNIRISVDGFNSINSVIINDPSLRPEDRRLHVSLTGANTHNTVMVNGSPKLFYS